MQPGGTIDARELLHHGDWIRALARSLVRDPNEADDLAQEAWLAAMKHGPRHGENVRGWFATVMHNALRMRRRSATRRTSRESASGERDALPSTAELVAEASLHERLVQLVLALDEPERSALLLHFFRNLSLSEIARRQGLPVSTVHARVQRGVSRLRRRLDHSFGAGAWFATVSARLAETPTPLGWIGRGLTTTQGKVAIVAVLGVAIWCIVEAWPSADATAGNANAARATLAAGSPSFRSLAESGGALALPDEAPTIPRRERVSLGAEAPREKLEREEPLRPTTTAIHGVHGRLIDEARHPFGYGVVSARSGGQRVASADVQADGTYSLGELPPGTYELRVDEVLAGYLPPFAQEQFAVPAKSPREPRFFATEITVTDPRAEIDVDLAVFRAARVSGFVGREDGSPLAEMPVRLQCTSAGRELVAFEDVAKRDGTIEFENVYPGSYRIEVLLRPNLAVPDAAAPTPSTLEIEGGARERLLLVFRESGTEVHGRVALGSRSPESVRVWAVCDHDGRANGKPITVENVLQIVDVAKDGTFSMRGLPSNGAKLFAAAGLGDAPNDRWRAAAWSSCKSARWLRSDEPEDLGVFELDGRRYGTYEGRLRWSSELRLATRGMSEEGMRKLTLATWCAPDDRAAGAERVNIREEGTFEFDSRCGHIFDVLTVSFGRRPPVSIWVDFNDLPPRGLDVTLQ